MEKLGLLCKKWPKVSSESYLNEEKASYLTRYVAFRAFLYKLRQQGTFSFYLRPAEHFFMLMRPLSGFEFETPDLGLK